MQQAVEKTILLVQQVEDSRYIVLSGKLAAEDARQDAQRFCLAAQWIPGIAGQYQRFGFYGAIQRQPGIERDHAAPAARQPQARARLQQVGWQRRDPFQQRGLLAALDQVAIVVLNQSSSALKISSMDSVMDGIVQQAVILEPLTGSPVEWLCLLRGELSTQEIGEQGMIAKPYP